ETVVPTSANGSGAAEDRASSQPDGACADILIVDDNAIVAAAMAKVIERGGYKSLVCHSGTAALDLVGSMNGHRASLVAALVDIHLPDLHGLVLSSKLRELLGQQVPIIVISGDTSMVNMNALQHVGAILYFHKPVNS